MKKTSVALLAAIALFCILLSSECYAVTYAYISNSADDTVSVINTSDNTVTATVSVGDEPWGVAVDPDGDYVYVTNKSGANVSVISTYYNTVTATIDVGSDPWGVAVTPNGDYIYVANYSDNTVDVISASASIATVDVGVAPSGVAVDPDGDYVYVTNNSDATVSVISTSNNEVTDTVDVGNGPLGVAVTPNGDYVYVTNNSDDTVSVIRTSDNTVTATVRVRNGPWGVAVHPNGNYVYVTNSLADTVSVIRTSDYDVTTVGVGNGPWGVAVNLDGDYIYVANNLEATVSVINTSDNAIADTISVGNSPTGLGKFIGGEQLQAPSDLVATTVSDEKIDLSWTDNSYDESGFKIERKKHDETFTEIDTADANVTSYRDKELDSDTTYYYRIRAYNDDGNSDYSNETDATTDDEDESDDCVISAGAQGTPLEPHVNVLRDFRDDFLLSNTVGKSFTDFYYTYSPPLAGIVSRHDSLRGMVCLSLLPVIGVSWVALKLGRVLAMAPILLLVTMISAPAIVLFRRTRLRGHRT